MVVVIIILGGLLSLFGGKVNVPKMETNAQGERQRVFRFGTVLELGKGCHLNLPGTEDLLEESKNNTVTVQGALIPHIKPAMNRVDPVDRQS